MKVYHLVVLLGFAVVSQGQTYSIDWYKVAGGGGTSTGAQYTVSGTIGQADAGGPMTGGSYSLTGGFWSLISVVQTPGAPLLTIRRSGNSVIVSWPSASDGFGLVQNSDVANPNGWFGFGGTINDDGTNKSVVVTPPVGKVFYRLKK